MFLSLCSIFKKFFLFGVGVGGLHCQSRIGKRESFTFPAFFFVRTSRKDTLKRFETTTKMAPRVGFEPTTLRLTGGRSTVELPGIVKNLIILYTEVINLPILI